MTEAASGRMLLAHNFDITDSSLPALSRADFTRLIVAGFQLQADILCGPVEHPHWVVAVQFPLTLTPLQVGAQIGQILATYRRVSDRPYPAILILGGSKTSPATSSDPAALQPGQWGVDVVETATVDRFLQGIGWAATVAGRSADSIFKVAIPATSLGVEPTRSRHEGNHEES